MSGFDSLHPAVQHHIVNSLGWPALRPLQELSIGPILKGSHCMLLAPTAGGKTEAAMFPIFSRMLVEGWMGLSVIYICPIKALLNNLHERLEQYSKMLGRRCAMWHGDVPASAKNRIRREPPDILLTTPESLEVLLVSNATNHRAFFAGVRAVVVDEIHAFAGDDRGWHLLSVLERVAHVSEHPVQRLGLSATVGNPAELLAWYAASADGEQCVVAPPVVAAAVETDVRLDYVGDLRNAAIVIARLHRGEKRLVFVDSRAAVEKLAASLREFGVTTFVSHSSLSADERRRAEEAFQTGTGCVIVATSTLELGIDVGDLDRVIQIDAPGTVASFLQRLGRTGRRSGTTRNCLFLATKEDRLLQAAALLKLWNEGYVEPIEPPAAPFHILAQQLMALALQEHGIGRSDWRQWIGAMPGFRGLEEDSVEAVIVYMLSEEILFSDGGMLSFGERGEEEFGYRNFMELLSVFTSPPVVSVRSGENDIGSVPQELLFRQKPDQPMVLLLSGRCWKVVDIEWHRKVAHVIPVEQRGVARWQGATQCLPFTLCQAMKSVLESVEEPNYWSRRAITAMTELRESYEFLRPERTVLVHETGDEKSYWWTFAGGMVNAMLSTELSQALGAQTASDDLAIQIDAIVPADTMIAAIATIRERLAMDDYQQEVPEDIADGLKFSQCLPKDILQAELAARSQDIGAADRVLRQSLASIVTND